MIAMKNFEMPENCNRCDLTDECGLCLVDNGSCDYDSIYRPTTCPLVEVGKWIPCSERLPEETDDSVLGIDSLGIICIAEIWDDCGQLKWYADGNYDVPIIAWMPIPPYKGVDDNG